LMAADGERYREAWQSITARLGAPKAVEAQRTDEPWLGFKVVYALDPKLSEPDQDEFGRSFINQAIEANGLFYHGGGKALAQGFANAESPASATPAQREAVTNWLRGNPAVVKFEVGPLEVEPDS